MDVDFEVSESAAVSANNHWQLLSRAGSAWHMGSWEVFLVLLDKLRHKVLPEVRVGDICPSCSRDDSDEQISASVT